MQFIIKAYIVFWKILEIKKIHVVGSALGKSLFFVDFTCCLQNRPILVFIKSDIVRLFAKQNKRKKKRRFEVLYFRRVFFSYLRH